MNNDPTIRLNINGGEVDAGRHNLSLFTFAGEAALYNHVFITLGEDEDNYTGAYVWSDREAYQPLMQFIVENNFTMHLNLNQVAECDIQAWTNHNLGDIGDYIPEGWDGTE